MKTIFDYLTRYELELNYYYGNYQWEKFGYAIIEVRINLDQLDYY
jgi:hypothetical protein